MKIVNCEAEVKIGDQKSLAKFDKPVFEGDDVLFLLSGEIPIPADLLSEPPKTDEAKAKFMIEHPLGVVTPLELVTELFNRAVDQSLRADATNSVKQKEMAPVRAFEAQVKAAMKQRQLLGKSVTPEDEKKIRELIKAMQD